MAVVGVITETAPRERRVALDPDGVTRLTHAGCQVLVEPGAGAQAWFPDDAYVTAGAALADRADVLARADVVLAVRAPSDELEKALRPGQHIVGMLSLLSNPHQAERLAAAGVNAISLDGLPRLLSRAQGMDALTSQANVAGYRSVLVAAEAFGRYLPMMVTAAGTARPAEVLILGAGVAGLQAIGTARRLGAQVRAYDVRPDSGTEVASLGAQFLSIEAVKDAAGEGGYARPLTDTEQKALAEELATHVVKHDIVIATAQVPGRRPPLLVTADAVAGMRPGSVVVDLAASPLGGNVAGSTAGERTLTPGGVMVIGADDLPSTMPTGASAAFSRNVSALLLHLLQDGQLVIDTDDEIQKGVVITHAGEVVHPVVHMALNARDSGEV
ncbi:MAG TPA: NAD(P) transhydrogenase subunit alpha [Mycobacteriales bacterium]|nr:NAD(P) transhydrogenase subunit alpha [Mycobacteriales bacterium]